MSKRKKVVLNKFVLVYYHVVQEEPKLPRPIYVLANMISYQPNSNTLAACSKLPTG